ncbi:sugar-transfer associated ATP-grasp domain-containing protein [Winogradskyella luteola]|uniref:Alpha-L-glutamate ligase-related protein ATP-grasp domain-containing protein n=1 Tax=Winogradskyella luteola TaxID=2828330 RepID=A0A9X1JNY3_9FLAO|nr:sugar-transfer associated ATP-grasp domain-containing protein [Winogradskyella luteola]MBV7268149.1 hypothetical protein [Winogradskyella luteola]
MRKIVDATKNILEKGRWYAFHKEQNNTARKHLKNIEAAKGKLDAKNIKLCKEYSKDVFGHERYAQWLIVYTTYTREFREGWIPDNYYGEVVLPQLNGEYGRISNRNAVITQLLKEEDTLDICYYVNRYFLTTDYKVLNDEALKTLLFSQHEKVVFKLENSRQGKGIYVLNEKSFDANEIRKLGNGVFQKFIEQHPFFSQFSTSSVATIRITSMCDDNGVPQARTGFFKFGNENDEYIKSSSAIYIPFDVKTGKLSHEAYTYYWKLLKQLPGNDFAFGGKELPSFNDCLAEVKRAHSQIPFVRCTGWDIILDKYNKVKIIEVNGGHNGITLNETTSGPNFKDLGWENLRKTK